jgi:hypothetical protein
MKPSEAINANRATIRSVIDSHRTRNARVFGSVLHGKDTDASDLDILVDPTPKTTLFDIGAIRHELGKLLGVPVDVLTPNALPDKFRAAVLGEGKAGMSPGQQRLSDYQAHVDDDEHRPLSKKVALLSKTQRSPDRVRDICAPS